VVFHGVLDAVDDLPLSRHYAEELVGRFGSSLALFRCFAVTLVCLVS